MNLQQLIERYIAYRQTLGERFKTNASILRAFGRCRRCRMPPSTDVRPEQVKPFLAGRGPLTRTGTSGIPPCSASTATPSAAVTLRRRPSPRVLPQRPPPFVPYIYSHDELRRLVRATDCYLRRSSRVEPLTLRTFVLLLYGTGLRLREAVSLDREDVDLRTCPADGSPDQVLQEPPGPLRPVTCSRILADYAARRGTVNHWHPGDPLLHQTLTGRAC